MSKKYEGGATLKKGPGFLKMLGQGLVFLIALLVAWIFIGGTVGLALRVGQWVIP